MTSKTTTHNVTDLRITLPHFLKDKYMSSLINYEKRKNQKLFHHLEKLGICNTQNYVPIYKNFFVLTENNFNQINLSHSQYITEIIRREEENIYKCKLAGKNGDSKTSYAFIKFAPLLDPVKYMIGKYSQDDTIMHLPSLASTEKDVHAKLLDTNNCSYVDSCFSFLSNQLFERQNFVNGVKFYGSFLAIKKDFKMNIFDDLDYLVKSEYFNKQKNKLFFVEDFYTMSDDDTASRGNLPCLQISEHPPSELHVEDIESCSFDNVFAEKSTENDPSSSPDLVPLTSENLWSHNQKDSIVDNTSMTLHPRDDNSDESCSSRTSHTNSHDNSEDECDDDGDEKEPRPKLKISNNINDDMPSHEDDIQLPGLEDNSPRNALVKNKEEEEESDDESDEESDDETIIVTFPEFPVQLICMEQCEATLDDLIIEDELAENEWFPMLMQVIMTLIAYQNAFSFTHNDLHTNNIMFITTKRKFLYYKVNGRVYRVPTHGRIFKIIDFGRAIYKYDGKTMCSDSFGPGGDASTQYNSEPYHNPKKPRLEPNFSFDLCRLACSIFDYFIDDITQMKPVNEYNNIVQLILEWCKDDNGVHMLYKTNGAERYPDFKLYKMIARRVHQHTPMAQLDRPEFSAFEISENRVEKGAKIMVLDDFSP